MFSKTEKGRSEQATAPTASAASTAEQVESLRNKTIPIESRARGFNVDGIDPRKYPDVAMVAKRAEARGFDVKLVSVGKDASGGFHPKFQVFRTSAGKNGKVVTPVGKGFTIERGRDDYLSARNTAITKALQKQLQALAKPKKPLGKIDPNQARLPKWSSASFRSEGFAERIKAIAPEIDTNSDSRLSDAELVRAIESDKFQKGKSIDVSTLYHYREEVSTLAMADGTGVSIADLKELDEQVRKSKNGAAVGSSGKLVTSMGRMLNHLGSQHSSLNRDLYRDADKALESIRPDAIVQGRIGDCAFLASLASVAGESPEIIRDSIRDRGDGTYRVTFAGDRKHPVTIKAPTEAEMVLFNKGSHRGTWACVMEKAYGQYCRDTGQSPVKGGLVAEGADKGKNPIDTLRLLTGERTTGHSINWFTKNSVRNNLIAAFKSGSSAKVVASSNIDLLNPGDRGQTADGFASQHAFSVLDFDPSGPKGGTVTLRNPWEGTPYVDYFNGEDLEKISFEKFVGNFRKVSITHPKNK